MNRSMSLYECNDCVLVFAVEEAFDGQSEIVCPLCQSDEALEDRGSGNFTLTREPDGDRAND